MTRDLALLDAAIDGRPALGRTLGCEIAESWAVFAEALELTRDTLAADPGKTAWGPRLFILEEPTTLVGLSGFKGAPRDGAVEEGYAIAPRWEGRGLGTAAVHELVSEAFAAREVQIVRAHTRAEPGPSVRVLDKAGFVLEAEVPDEELGKVWRFGLHRARD